MFIYAFLVLLQCVMHIGKVIVGEIIAFIGNPQNKFCRIKKDDCSDLPNDMNYYPSICVGEKITSH